VALVGTGLFALSFYSARALDSGMDVRNVASVKYYVETFCHTRDERTRFCLRLGERLRALPGVAAVSYSDNIPLEFGDRQQTDFAVEGYVPAAGEHMQAPNCSVAPGYFGLLRIPLLEGRDFSELDDTDTAPVMIVNQAFARRYFGGGSPLGRRIRTGGLRFTVIGLAADAKYQHLTEGATPYYYTAYRQTHGGEFWVGFFVRTAGPVRGALAELDREAATVDPGARASNFVAYQGWMEASLYGQRVAATLVGVVGAISLILSAVGLYSVLAFAVSQRRNEFGIRMALGAGPWRLLATVLRQGLGLTAAGLGAGALAAMAAMRFATSYLPKLKMGDPQVFAGAILVLTLVALLASYLPARRAMRVDPVDALRQE
jgi:predicted permease